MLQHIIRLLTRHPVLLAATLIAIGWLIIEIRGILLTLFISYIIMTALNPTVSKLQEYKFPRTLAAIIVYLLALTIVFLIIVPLVPFFAEQIQSLSKQFPIYLDSAATILGLNLSTLDIQSIFTNEIQNISRNALGVTQKVFGGIFSFLSVLVISFYLLLDHPRMKKGLIKLFPKKDHERVGGIFTSVENNLGSWLRGQLVLSFAIGLFTYLALLVIGVPFALPLALIAGMLEIIPTIGPIIAAVPAAIIAFDISPTTMIIVIGVYIALQILENNLLVPKIMQRAVGLNPVIIIVGIIIGGKLLGVTGALLSIPFLSLIKVLITETAKE